MSLRFPDELVIGGSGEWDYKPFRFNLPKINIGKSEPSWKDVITSGVSPLALTNAIELNYIKALGATEQNGTPTPTTPVDITCNNGVVKVNVNFYWTEYKGYQLSQVDGVTLTVNAGVNVSGMVDCRTIKSFKITTISPTGSLRIYKYRTDNTFINASSVANIGDIVTLGDDVGFFRIQYNFTNSGVGTENILIYNNAYNLNEIYTDGTQETVNITNGGTANAEMLLSVGDYKDNQELLTGNITRNVGIKVLDGTEGWASNGGSQFFITITDNAYQEIFTPYSTHYKGIPNNASISSYPNQYVIRVGHNSNTTWRNRVLIQSLDYTTVAAWQQYLAEQYANGTPVIIVYLLATSTTETVSEQSLTASGNCTVTSTGSLDNLSLEVSYKAAVQVTITEVQNSQLSNNVEVTIND